MMQISDECEWMALWPPSALVQFPASHSVAPAVSVR